MAQLWTGSDQDFKDLFLRLKMREEFLPIGPLIQFGTDHRDFANIWDESAGTVLVPADCVRWCRSTLANPIRS